MTAAGDGLKGVVLDDTRIALIDGEQGKLVYRGYNIHDLAKHASFEEVSYLLLYGALPNRAQLGAFADELRAGRHVPQAVLDIVATVKAAHPMDILRTAMSATAALDESRHEATPDAALPVGVRMISQVATIVAAMHRVRSGLEPVAPRDDLSHAANFLYMMFGREPSPEDARIIDLDLVLHAEHSSNASTFAARVAAGTAADIGSAIVAAISTLKGPLHGGAAEAVQKTVEEIGDPDRAIAYIKDKIEAGEKVMGFGHRVYKTEDPRGAELRGVARQLGHARGNDRWFQILQQVEKAMEPYRAKGIYPNVDFYAGAVYSLLGIPEEYFVPMFAVGRMPGWVAHVLEQYSDNVLIRPLLEYTGPRHLRYTPIAQRGA
ncbi:MAG: citrate (Si)-synthase [Chloroflexi bacterium]|nr:citrate (Si)-synthase [Chloroflexota bacterium]